MTTLHTDDRQNEDFRPICLSRSLAVSTETLLSQNQKVINTER